MKRLILVCAVAIAVSLSVDAQLLGDGSIANPYRGTLAGNFTISGIKYFNGNIVADNERLTIAAGTTLISIDDKAGIIINGTGQIYASGTKSRRIWFTADLDLDGIYGESTDVWGNISVQSSGTSLLNFCIIERGRRTDPGAGSYGGGLNIGTSSLSVTNCVIRNCRAAYGGAIAVAGSSAPVITGCTLTDNVANQQGGGIYITDGSSPVITNVILNRNSSLSPTLKGGTIVSLNSSPIIVNSIIAYSNARVPDGTSVYLENSPGARIINTIIWGGSDHIGLSGTPSSVFDYCAVEGASLAGCINLNSNNTAPDGPNFINPVLGFFNIDFNSPCRDTGADSYPGVTIPALDFNGVGRIDVTDIGAYEMIYSLWTGQNSPDWTSSLNWDEGFTPGSKNIVIPAGLPTYPTLSPGPSFTLISGYRMIMEPGVKATFSSLTNSGIIEIHADANGMASLLTNSFSGAGGSLNVDIRLKATTPDTYLWHYIAPPATVSKTVFTDIEPYNLMLYDESKVTTDVVQGWQWHDGYGGATAFSTLEAKKGYQVMVDNDITMVFRNLTSLTTSMGQINLPFSGSGGDTSLFGYTLVGNSLTCGLNWDAVTVSTGVRNGYYLYVDGVDISYVNGVGTNGGTAHIPPLHGFFVKSRAIGTYMTIPDNAREHNATPRYKSAQVIPLIRLTLVSPKSEDETVIRFEPMATNDFDDEFDAGKMFAIASKRALIYSEMNGENYSVNSVPWPETKTVIPLTLKIPEAGTYKIRRSQLQGTDNSKITLSDKVAGKSVDLLAFTEYSFSAQEGKLAGRFTVTVSSNKPEPFVDQAVASSLKIYASSGKICILPQGNEWENLSGNVKIYDITGRMIMNGGLEWFNSGEVKEYSPSGARGMLIVELTAGGKRYLEKIVLTAE